MHTPPQLNPGAKSESLSPLGVYAIWVIKNNPPEEFEALEWMLLANLPIETLEQFLEKFFWYKQRWYIENSHKVFKSGCNIEKTSLNPIEKLKELIALVGIVA